MRWIRTGVEVLLKHLPLSGEELARITWKWFILNPATAAVRFS